MLQEEEEEEEVGATKAVDESGEEIWRVTANSELVGSRCGLEYLFGTLGKCLS